MSNLVIFQRLRRLFLQEMPTKNAKKLKQPWSCSIRLRANTWKRLKKIQSESIHPSIFHYVLVVCALEVNQHLKKSWNSFGWWSTYKNLLRKWWMVKPVGLPGCVSVKREGEDLPRTKKRKTFPPYFSTVEKKHCEVQQFQGSWCPGRFGGGKTSSSSTTGLGLAPFGSWCLFGAMKKTGRRFLLNFFASEKKHIWTWVSFFQAGYFLGFLVGIGKGFTLEMLFQDAFFSSRIFIDTFCRRNQLHFWILKFWWEEDFTRKLGKEMYIPVKSTKYMYIYIQVNIPTPWRYQKVDE